ncbi:unnamed protein product [Closterium sp. NIES-65]|nr:unnamed protein product [Closterium sp. NIES-65]
MSAFFSSCATTGLSPTLLPALLPSCPPACLPACYSRLISSLTTLDGMSAFFSSCATTGLSPTLLPALLPSCPPACLLFPTPFLPSPPSTACQPSSLLVPQLGCPQLSSLPSCPAARLPACLPAISDSISSLTTLDGMSAFFSSCATTGLSPTLLPALLPSCPPACLLFPTPFLPSPPSTACQPSSLLVPQLGCPQLSSLPSCPPARLPACLPAIPDSISSLTTLDGMSAFFSSCATTGLSPTLLPALLPSCPPACLPACYSRLHFFPHHPRRHVSLLLFLCHNWVVPNCLPPSLPPCLPASACLPACYSRLHLHPHHPRGHVGEPSLLVPQQGRHQLPLSLPHRRVQNLLNNNQLTGTIPSAIFTTTNLKYLPHCSCIACAASDRTVSLTLLLSLPVSYNVSLSSQLYCLPPNRLPAIAIARQLL